MAELISPTPSNVDIKKRAAFFQDKAMKNLSEMRLLFTYGHLRKKDQWRNVSEHCLLQGVAAEVVADWFQLSEADKQKVKSTALIHDWKKRLEKKPGDFEDSAKEAAQAYAARLNVDDKLLSATSEDFVIAQFQKLKNKIKTDDSSQPNFPDLSLLEKLVYYLDEITEEDPQTLKSDIVPLLQRVTNTEKRRSKMNADQDLLQRLDGTPYWEAVRVVGSAIEQDLWLELQTRSVEIYNPEAIPFHIKQVIESNYT